MFVRQAAGQFLAWTGIQTPKELMRKVIVERIGK
jgi:shikimate 5-dehydrogenase